MAIDSNYYSSSLILNCEGADASTTFTDISITPKTPTVNGDAKIATAQFKSGAASAVFDGTGDYLSYTSHADFDFGTGDFTIELWWRPTGASTDYALVVLGKPTISTQADQSIGLFHLGSTGAGKIQAFINQGTTNYIVNGLSALTAGTWYHIAFERISGSLYLFINGVQQGSTAANIPINEPTSRTLRFGTWHTGSTFYANGYMDAIRLTKGVGRYPAGLSFTPSSDLFEATPPSTGGASVTLPSVGLNAYAGANSGLTLPVLALAGYAGANSDLTLPTIRLSGFGHDSTGENSLNLALPALTLSGYAGATARVVLPSITIEAAGTGTSMGRALLMLPALQLSAGGVGGATGRSNLRLPGISMVEAFGGGYGAVVLPSILMSGQVQSGSVGSALMELPALLLLAAGTAQDHGSAVLVLPPLRPGPSGQGAVILPALQLLGQGRLVVVVTYEAYAVNLKPSNRAGKHEVTHYTNWPFDGIVRHGNRHYAWGPSGLYLLGGTTDDGDVAISWSWKTAITDFKSPMGKNVPAGIIRGRIGPSVTASVSVGERADKTYAATIVRGQNAQNHRIKFGRGTDDTYYSFGMAGTGQGDVTELALDVTEHKRRI